MKYLLNTIPTPTGTRPDMVDVIVVGAGVSGLTAARRLAQDGRDVLVLEAQERVAGDSIESRLGMKGAGPLVPRPVGLISEVSGQASPKPKQLNMRAS